MKDKIAAFRRATRQFAARVMNGISEIWRGITAYAPQVLALLIAVVDEANKKAAPFLSNLMQKATATVRNIRAGVHQTIGRDAVIVLSLLLLSAAVVRYPFVGTILTRLVQLWFIALLTNLLRTVVSRRPAQT